VRLLSRSIMLALAFLTVLHAQQVARARGQKPAFKANADYVEIPVRVLDRKGLTVRDLTQSDFEILEDGAPQRIVNFTFLDTSLQHRMPPAIRETSEPASTTHVYVVVLDDSHISREDTVKARSLVTEFIRRYAAPDDGIAIVFMSGSPGQDVTRDRSLLSAALDRFRGQWDPTDPPALKEAKALDVIKMIGQISRGLADTARGLRRAILLVSAGVGCSVATVNPSGIPWCGSYMTETLREAAANDVVVYSIDPRGGRNPTWVGPVVPGGGTGAIVQAMRGAGDSAPNVFDGMHFLANESGGFSVTGTDGFADAFKRIVNDFGEYYILGYYSDRRDLGPALRRNEVRVNRPGTKAFYRSTYVAPQ
jgi:VWFA-related protein